MLKKETRYVHDKHFEVLHSDLEPQMRSILLDWLLEVCEVYTLHRETFYLAQDFFDRFMLTQKDINKNMLQLIGITSLFIASKLEVSSQSLSTDRFTLNSFYITSIPTTLDMNSKISGFIFPLKHFLNIIDLYGGINILPFVVSEPILSVWFRFWKCNVGK